MADSVLMQQNCNEQCQEMMKTPDDQLQIALELSNACLLLNSAPRGTLEKERKCTAHSAGQKVQACGVLAASKSVTLDEMGAAIRLRGRKIR